MVTAANIFEPTYEVIQSKAKVINDLKRAARGAKAIYLAGDPDREGEAICAHLAVVLSTPDEIVEEDPAAAKNGKKSGKAKLVAKPVAVLKATKNWGPAADIPGDVQRNHAEGDQGCVRAPNAGE